MSENLGCGSGRGAGASGGSGGASRPRGVGTPRGAPPFAGLSPDTPTPLQPLLNYAMQWMLARSSAATAPWHERDLAAFFQEQGMSAAEACAAARHVVQVLAHAGGARRRAPAASSQLHALLCWQTSP